MLSVLVYVFTVNMQLLCFFMSIHLKCSNGTGTSCLSLLFVFVYQPPLSSQKRGGNCLSKQFLLKQFQDLGPKRKTLRERREKDHLSPLFSVHCQSPAPAHTQVDRKIAMGRHAHSNRASRNFMNYMNAKQRNLRLWPENLTIFFQKHWESRTHSVPTNAAPLHFLYKPCSLL